VNCGASGSRTRISPFETIDITGASSWLNTVIRLLKMPISRRLALRRVGRFVELLAGRVGRLAGDDRQHAGQLYSAHHRGFGAGPGE